MEAFKILEKQKNPPHQNLQTLPLNQEVMVFLVVYGMARAASTMELHLYTPKSLCSCFPASQKLNANSRRQHCRLLESDLRERCMKKLVCSSVLELLTMHNYCKNMIKHEFSIFLDGMIFCISCLFSKRLLGQGMLLMALLMFIAWNP